MLSTLAGAGGGFALATGLLYRRLAAARHAAGHDEVTGLPNRRALLSHLRRALNAGDGPVAVALLDLDRFKAVNDRYGHATGDALLAAVADRLRTLGTPVRLAARLGGDEFALVLTADRDTAARAASTAHTLLTGQPYPLGPPAGLAVQVSIGVATAGFDVEVRRLLHHADAAMYAAKAAGGGVRLHTGPNTTEIPHRPATRLRDRRRP